MMTKRKVDLIPLKHCCITEALTQRKIRLWQVAGKPNIEIGGGGVEIPQRDGSPQSPPEQKSVAGSKPRPKGRGAPLPPGEGALPQNK